MKRLAFLLRPGWIAVILAGLAFAGACFFLLAPWQFNRNAERSAQNAAITAALGAAPVPVSELMSTSAQPSEGALWHVVTATGTFDESRQVQVRLRQNSAGQPISEVVLPFRLTSGTTCWSTGVRSRSWRSTRGSRFPPPRPARSPSPAACRTTSWTRPGGRRPRRTARSRSPRSAPT